MGINQGTVVYLLKLTTQTIYYEELLSNTCMGGNAGHIEVQYVEVYSMLHAGTEVTQ